MKFEEAVKAMKEGKKVRRKLKDGSGWQEYTENQVIFTWESIDATDWEIIEEDKDWNGADNLTSYFSIGVESKYQKCVTVENYIKTRDLILEDMNNANRLGIKEFQEIVNKRFGDLE